MQFSTSPNSIKQHQQKKKKTKKKKNMGYHYHYLPLLLFFLIINASITAEALVSSKLGINYGQLGENLPSPTQSLRLIKSIHAGAVKIYDANPDILTTLSNTQIPISIMVPNQLIPTIAGNISAADTWVRSNLLRFLPDARIRYLLVGNEVLSDYSVRNSTWPFLVPAIVNIKRVLGYHSVKNVKVGTTLAMDALSSSFPPSAGEFRPDIAKGVIYPLLKFLRKTRSFYFVDAYPYFVWAQNSNTVSFDYALLDPKAAPFVDPNTKLVYNNMLEQQLDSVAFAMEKLGFKDVRISIAETGWPNAGDYDEIGANVRNAATYTRNLAKWVASGSRTPARPKPNNSPSFVFSLYNENQKGGPGTERHWGVFYPNGSNIYDVDLSSRTPVTAYPPLPRATNNTPYKGKIWCVVAEEKRKTGTNTTKLGGAVAYACGQGNGTCDAIRSGGKCYSDSLLTRASYAFNSYWQQLRLSGGTCYFDGLAEQTIVDPSYGSCKFPSI